MKTLTIEIPGKLALWLDRQARRRGRTPSELVKEALAAKQAEEQKPSCAKMLGGLDGFFEGPPDLSANRRYLEEMGA
jgi:predicted transcriptional regulator